MRRATALSIIKIEWAQHGKDTLQSTRAFIENRVSKQARDKAAEEGRAIYLHQCATDAAEQIEREKAEEEAGDLIENMILDTWKRQGGIYEQAAEEYEKDTELCKQAKAELEREELDAIEFPISQARIEEEERR